MSTPDSLLQTPALQYVEGGEAGRRDGKERADLAIMFPLSPLLYEGENF